MYYKLRSFISYYGGKRSIAPKYPEPSYDTIIEPFAGSAGYATYHYYKNVILVDKYRVIADIWQWLIDVTVQDFLSLPTEFIHLDDIKWLSQVEKNYLGFRTSMSPEKPAKCINVGYNLIRKCGWTATIKKDIAEQLQFIRHWKVYCDDYYSLPNDMVATWFVDPPYHHREGRRYVHNKIDYSHLGEWCKSLKGDVIACENLGANWLPFVPLCKLNGAQNKRQTEMIWYARNH